jgi:D-3-phosphoglycerate dehydrogenase / 2-oxoglutarate reductase
MKILVVGDSYMPPLYFRQAFSGLQAKHEVQYIQVDPAAHFTPTSPSELRIKEYQGTPGELSRHMEGVQVLVVQGAPVTDTVLDASTELRLVGCARGGPVNIDVQAVSARGVTLVTAPGKNAEAVADQTLAFLIMLARGFPRAQRFLDEGHQLKDNWEGAKFIGSDLRGHMLGLVGYGHVGRRVAHRALAFDMTVLAYDPYLNIEPDDGVEQVWTFRELLGRSDFVSVHARATSGNIDLFNASAFEMMRHGAYFVNTARETLVNEDALNEALKSGRLAGAALDVVRPTAEIGRHRLLRHPNVVMTPHIGGATRETLLQGAEMLADEVSRFMAGDPMLHVANQEVSTP